MIPLSSPLISNEEIKNVTDTIRRGSLSQGNQVAEFERATAKFLGVDSSSVIAVSSGTAALSLATSILEPKLEFQVMHVPAITFIATINSILSIDKEADVSVKIEDIEPDTWNMYPCPGYKVTVDLYGNSNQYKYLDNVVIEDAAEAFGSEYDGKKCGTFGDFGVFSFFENKTITTGGEGGLLYCKNKEDADKARLLRQQGKDYAMELHKYRGYNYRMTEMQAAFGLAQLKRVNLIIEAKRHIHALYKDLIDDTVSFQREIGKQCPWLTCVKFTSKYKRDKAKEKLKEANIQSRLPFAPLYYNPPYQSDKSYCPAAEVLYNGGLCLPNFSAMTDDQVRQVCRIIKTSEEETKY